MKFNELDSTNQQKAIDKLKDINMYEGWHEHTIESFMENCLEIGLDISDTRFTGFYSQGDGASFEGTYSIIRVNELKDKGLDQAFLDCATTLTDIIENNHSMDYLDCSLSYDLEFTYCHSNTMILSNCPERTIESEDTAILQAFRALADHLYSLLSSEYDYLTSDAAIKESILANDLDFKISDPFDNTIIL